MGRGGEGQCGERHPERVTGVGRPENVRASCRFDRFLVVVRWPVCMSRVFLLDAVGGGVDAHEVFSNVVTSMFDEAGGLCQPMYSRLGRINRLAISI